jgi:Cu2+-containing amine oxidase
MAPHPFKILNMEETLIARDTVLSLYKDSVVDFREIFLQEPEKELMKQYLELEHSAKPGQSLASKRPPRLAKCQYDVVGTDKVPEYHECLIDLEQRKRVRHEVVRKEFQASLTMWEFGHLVEACKRSDMFQKAVAEFKLPDGFELVVEPWFVTLPRYQIEKPHMLIDLGHMADLTSVPRTKDTFRDFASLKIQGTAMLTPTFTRTHCRSFPSWTQQQERSVALIA